MFAKVLVAAGLAVSLAGYVANRPAAESAPVRPQATPAAMAEATRLADPTPPAGFPASFRVRFTTSVGENIDTRAVFVGGTEDTEMEWRSPPVRYTLDHPSLNGSMVISTPVRVKRYARFWWLQLGNARAEIVSGLAAQRTPTDFDLPMGVFRGFTGTSVFTGVSVAP